MSAAVPDPVGFVMEALADEGALCEREADKDRATALLPAEVAQRLEVPEDVVLAARADAEDEVACGLGSPLLEKLVAEARGRCPVVSLRLDVDAPKPAHARALAERFVLRNGLAEPGQVTMGTARYAAAYVAYAVEADDRREGLVRIVTAPDGGEPDDAALERLDLSWPDLPAEPAEPVGAPGDVARWIVARAEQAVRVAAAALVADIARRQARDHERIAEYFAALVGEARAPRRKVDPKALEAKVGHLLAERDKKLRDLEGRYAVQVRASLAAVAWVELPAAYVATKLRRRKEVREITLRVPAGASTVDRPACDACAAPAAKPAACDDRLHLLCETCAPSAQGRIPCPACAKRR